MGLKRIQPVDRINILPLLLYTFKKILENKESQNNKKIIDQLLCLTVESWISISQICFEKWPKLEALQCISVRKKVLLFMQKLIQFPHINGEAFVETVASDNCSNELGSLLPGDYNLIGKEIIGVGTSIRSAKMAIVEILSTSLFKKVEIFPLLALASGSDFIEIKNAANDSLKKFDIDEILKEKETITKLFKIYLGDEPNNIQPITSASVKIVILKLLVRSKIAPKMFTDNMKVVYDGLFGEHRTRDPSKLLQLSAEFLFLQIKNCPSSAQQTLSPIYFSTIKKLLNDDERWSATAAICYRCMAEIGRNNKSLVTSDFVLVQHLFDIVGKIGYARDPG
ncbi:unnamed protein product [Dracunculus medinensis]|uniref:Proteasome component Ecm29 N-terminal domain-containing protein n=1 Tax=Dracunculus medinensis TaxID=318479 RepID=A0A0N4US42_DRAME|nr:unnamed protein product [Dracunculus medinensis]